MMLQEYDTIKWSTTNTTEGLQGQKSLQPRKITEPQQTSSVERTQDK